MRHAREAMRIAPLLAAVAAVAITACGGTEETDGARPEPAPPAAAPEPAPAPEPAAPAPEPAAPAAPAGGARSGDGPAYIATSAGAVSRGATLYASYCATCHGPGGKGDGPASAGFDPPPADHTNGAYMNQLSNEHLFRIVKEGGPAVGKSPLMAAWGSVLSDQQIREVVAFVRSLAEPPYEPDA